ncbi:MAG TPA: leucyl/phenylalanyl-tRNA--protein transferase [Candidatus Kapabacteria bacterium]|nr:leucyl/phenylalanyl-tRNA--protein transferase [Candidatus Kapabacteria bacterium]
MTSPLTANRFITPELVLDAYEQGLFPMANEHGEIGFYMYEPRGIVPLDDRFTIRRSLRQVLKKKKYRVTFDTAPLEILRGCSRAGLVTPVKMWLSDELIEHYFRLFEAGRMHTVEVWKVADSGRVGSGQSIAETNFPLSTSSLSTSSPSTSSLSTTLVGGLYGLTFGAVFCGESMFSREDYASQIALVHLVDRLRNKGFRILDAQMPSDHLRQFGLYEMSQHDYLELFREAAVAHVSF